MADCCNRPSTANATRMFFVVQDDCNTLPDNPTWTPFPFTGSVPTVNRDLLQSAVLDGTPEITYSRLGVFNVASDTAVELAFGQHDDLFASAMQNDWVINPDLLAQSVEVDTTTENQVKILGADVVESFPVGSMFAMPGLTLGANAAPLKVVSATADSTDTVLIVSEFADECSPLGGGLVDETGTTDINLSDSISIGTTRKYLAVLVEYGDMEGGPYYDMITGCQITSFSFNLAVNANVTGSLPLIGRYYYPGLEFSELPAGSTLAPQDCKPPFTGIDGRVSFNEVRLAGVQSIDIGLDRGASPVFEVGSKYISDISYTKAVNSVSISNTFGNYDLIDKYVGEDRVSASVSVSLDGQAMSFVYGACVISNAEVDVSEGDNGLSIELQPDSNCGQISSLVIYRLS